MPTIHRRLSQVLETAITIPIDDSSKFVFFSDLHRGNGSRSDSFLPNARLFLHALTHYERNGFSYVEVGDGDELWKGWPIEAIRQAHRRLFDLLHQMDLEQRLHLILGNHDLKRKTNLRIEKDGLPAQEGLVLKHEPSGHKLFVVHGHQADITNDYLYFVAHRAVRFSYHVRERLQQLCCSGHAEPKIKMGKLEQRLMDWVSVCHQMIICGHTHRQAFPQNGGPAYFNTGSGIVPGVITGLELRNGALVPIRWTEPRRDCYVRQQVGPSRPLDW
ncbi:MAG TPA: metallophosphoesterase [Anaerolineales bacterium]|nr:metallophosphoesterase [Anaerolineales bacterium]